MVETVQAVQYRVTTPDGRLIDSWIVAPYDDQPWRPVTTPHIWLRGEMFVAPWRVERRAGNGDWELIDDSEAAAKRRAMLKP